MLFLGIKEDGSRDIIQTPGYKGSIIRINELYPRFAILCHTTCNDKCPYHLDCGCSGKEVFMQNNLFLVQVAFHIDNQRLYG